MAAPITGYDASVLAFLAGVPKESRVEQLESYHERLSPTAKEIAYVLAGIEDKLPEPVSHTARLAADQLEAKTAAMAAAASKG